MFGRQDPNHPFAKSAERTPAKPTAEKTCREQGQRIDPRQQRSVRGVVPVTQTEEPEGSPIGSEGGAENSRSTGTRETRHTAMCELTHAPLKTKCHANYAALRRRRAK